MAYDFPAAPTEGQEYTPAGSGTTYVWNSPRWLVKTAPAGGLPASTKAQYDASLTDGNFVFQGDAITSLTGTKAQYDASLSDGDFSYVGHTHTAAAVTGTMAQYDASLTDGDFVYQGHEATLDTLTMVGDIQTSTSVDTLAITGGNAFGTTGASIALRGSTGAYNAHGMEFYSGGAFERMRITAAGKVGIGTTTPATALHVDGDWITTSAYGAGVTAALIMRQAGGTAAAPTAVGPAVQQVGTVSTLAYDGAAYRSIGAISFRNDGAITSTSSPGHFMVHLTPPGTVAAVERLKVGSLGKLITTCSEIVTNPATLDLSEPFVINAGAPISGLTYSDSDPRLMSFCVTPQNFTMMRAVNPGLFASFDAKIQTGGGQSVFNFSSAGNLGMGRAATRTGIDIYNGTNEPGVRVSNNSCTFDIGLSGVNAWLNNLNSGSIYFATNNVVAAYIDAAGNFVEVNGIYAGAVVQTPQLTLSGGTGSFYIRANGATNALINFDAGDYLQYDQTNNTLSFSIGAATTMVMYPGYTMVPSNSTIRFGDTKMYIHMDPSAGGYCTFAMDDTDIFRFERASNTFQFIVGGTVCASIQPTTSTFSSNLSTSGQIFSTNGMESHAQIRTMPPGAGGAAITNGGAAVSGYLSLFRSDTVRTAYIGYMDTAVTGHLLYVNELVGFHVFNTHVVPNADATIWCGLEGGYRWYAMAAATNYIVTSDAREKDWLGPPSEAAIRAAGRIIDELGFYRWNTGIDDKVHFGIRAQSIIRILIEEGLEDAQDIDFDPSVRIENPPVFRHGFVTFSTWDEEIIEYAPDEDGVVAEPTVKPAGNRFGVRSADLALFISTAQHARMNAIEARLAALGG